MGSTAYSEDDDRTLLILSDVCSVSCHCVRCVSFLGDPGVCAVFESCSPIPGTAVTLCLDTVFCTPSSTTVCNCTTMIWKGPNFRGCSLIQLGFAVSFTVLVLSVNGDLSINTHWLSTNHGSTCALVLQSRFYCVPCLSS